MDNFTEEKSQELMTVLNNHIGDVVFLQYYKSPNSSESTSEYVVVSKVAEDRLTFVTAFQDTLITNNIPFTLIETVAKNHTWYSEGNEALYYSVDEKNITL